MSYASSRDVAARVEDSVLHLTLTKPEKKNALTDSMVHDLIGQLARANLDEQVRAILLDAEGPAFCVGSDIVARNAGTSAKPRSGTMQRRLPGHAHRLISVLRDVQAPVVVAAQGWAAGLGLALVLAGDFAVVADDVTLWAPYSARGISPDSGVSWLLPRYVGIVRAREVLLLGRKLDGPTAVDWGLAHSCVPRDDLAARAAELAGQLASGPTVATGLTKWLVNEGADLPLENALHNEAFGMELSARSEDFKEGFTAFRERRPPTFTGR
jgi:2-(1,2-epoxy-1,2-dihydrophenyl)acetyl-CoA isomerase